jgi:hypothetical protein
VGLSEDQKAMLRLLAQREQGYDDIAALMGLSVAEVRERVGDALSQLEEEGESAPRVEAPAAAGPDEAHRPAGPVVEGGTSSSQAAGEAPPSTPPAAEAAEPEGSAASASAAEPKPAEAAVPGPAAGARKAGSGAPRLSLPAGNGARAAIGAAVVGLVAVVVVLIVSGGGGSSDTTSAAGSSQAQTRAESESALSGGAKQVTKAVLGGVGGSEAAGVAIFGRVKNKLALEVEAEGLSPTGQGRSYTVWLAQSSQKMLPLASTAVAKDGRIGAQFEVPTEVLAYLASEAFDKIVVTETEDATLKAALKKATSEKQAPEYTGTAVLEGTVTGPIVGAAKQQGG